MPSNSEMGNGVGYNDIREWQRIAHIKANAIGSCDSEWKQNLLGGLWGRNADASFWCENLV